MGFLLAPREAAGRAIGAVWSPVAAAISTVRHARTFHPDGIVCRGKVEPMLGPYEVLGARLRGPVLARFSAALWKGAPRWFDVLGIALRFGDDQDLLFATIRSPFTMLVSPLATETDDFLGNRYWAVSPFVVDDVGRMKFRLRPAVPTVADAPRATRLAHAVEHGAATFVLEARPVFRRHYHPVARVHLARLAPEVDQDALRFDPFRAGRGIHPSGLVHAIRPGAYRGSQRGRA